MADVKWIKIVTDIFDDEKMLLIDGLPEHDSIIVIWFKLLCMAGKQNNGGVFMLNDKIAYTEEMLSTVFRRPINTVRLALKTFEQFGMIEIVNETITIPNWERYQNIDRLNELKEYNRLAKQRSRERKRLSSNVNDMSMTSQPSQDTDIDKNIEIEKESDINNISVEFETLWKMYPRKVGKEAALKAYKKARSDKKNPTTFEQVKQGIENYIKQIEAKQTDVQYIKHGSSWFNARAWNDDYDFSPQKTPSKGSQLVKINGKEYEYRNGKYYVPHGCGIAVDPYAEDNILDGIL